MKKICIRKFSVQSFKNQLNSKAHSPYLFEIIDETYIDMIFDRDVSDDKQICGLIRLLYGKLPILLERQLRDQGQGCAAFQLKFDIDAVTKQKGIGFPIMVIENDKLIFDPMICSQKTYFEVLEQKILKEQYVEIQFDIEQFGIVLILFKLWNLLNKKLIASDAAIFDIMIYPSVLNFAIIKKHENHEALYFYNDNHKELFFKQNSKYHHIDLLSSFKTITLHSDQIVNTVRNATTLFQNEEQNTREQYFQKESQEVENEKFQFNQNNEQIKCSIFSVYNKEDIIENGILIANRNDDKFREKIKYTPKSGEEEIFYVVKNDVDLSFSKSCKSYSLLHHQVGINDDKLLKCSCGNEIIKENFDKLIMDFKFRNLVMQVQQKLLYDKNLDSCLFKIPLNIRLNSDQYQNQFAVASINDQKLFQIPYNYRVYYPQVHNVSEQRNQNLFEKIISNTEEDWSDELQHNEQRNDANNTQKCK